VSKRRHRETVTGPGFSRVLRAASLALRYPDSGWHDSLPLLAAAAGSVAGPGGTALLAYLAAVGRRDHGQLQREYVETFDLNRRCCPYLTYYSSGDTRKRGMALLQFTASYRAAGFELVAAPPADRELPDHLAVLSEFTAAEPERGLALFRRHRVGLELLRNALSEVGSPWLHPVDAIRAVLPEPAPRDLRRALDLARTGPPAEEVGLEPFAPPDYLGGRR
jgi:nitrate reductase delta subunit